MSKEIRVHVIRPTVLRGERVEPGTMLRLPAMDAADLVRNGKATLHDEADEAALSGAVVDAYRRVTGNPAGGFPRSRWGTS